jgi:hypothetical protein
MKQDAHKLKATKNWKKKNGVIEEKPKQSIKIKPQPNRYEQEEENPYDFEKRRKDKEEEQEERELLAMINRRGSGDC